MELYRCKVTSQVDCLVLHFFISFKTGGMVVVRPEEALIVIFVLLLWMGAIGLFVHRYDYLKHWKLKLKFQFIIISILY